MNRLTSLQHAKLIESIKQWGDSQDRIQAEQDHQSALAAVLQDEFQISVKHFKKVAKAYWADTVKKDREDAEMQMESFEMVRGQGSFSWLEENSGSLERIDAGAMQ